MMLNVTQVIEKYRGYGFEYKKAFSNDSYLTFTFKSGFFHNAEIVKIRSSQNDYDDIQKKITTLNGLGISAKITEYSQLSEIEDGLFTGFFNVDSWRERINHEYDNYINSIMSSYPSFADDIKYSYINAPYSIVNQKEENTKPIIDNIVDRLNDNDAQLILVEAPAGFGKTCTSYELIKNLTSNPDKPIPFFTEFSRDRQARIFSHVFIREVDRAFTQVKSNIVEEELKNGRIVMVLDGFDELLSDSQKTDPSDDYENAEPMLDTISELLCKKAKIIITSRRSAIFDGATFSEWIDSFDNKFKFIRYKIESPRIEDWLPEVRRNRLKEIGIELNKIANPVLLSYLRFLSDEKFNELCNEPDQIVEKYFTSMLEREQERQNLLMSPLKQSDILTELAADMCKNNYTSEAKEKIIIFFKEKCALMLEDARKLYKPSDRPTIESLCNTLSNHAFFDRSHQGEDRIEFINEFVFGNYIAEDILRSDNENGWMASDERFVEPAIIAYSPRNSESKISLWTSLKMMIEFLSDTDRFKYELIMLGSIHVNSYSHTSIMSLNLYSILLFDKCSVEHISFSDCTFNDVIFHIPKMKDATFINCKFYNCELNGALNNSSNFSLLNCKDNNNFISILESYEKPNDNEESDKNRLTKLILERYWRIGSDNIDRVHIPLASIFKTCQSNGYSKKQITINLKKMKQLGLLTDAADDKYIAINVQNMNEIRSILGK